MSFNNSFTAVTGVTYTAAQYNTYTKGNLTAIWVGTTAGDMEYYTSATAKQRVGIGIAYESWRVNAGATAPEWGQPPFVTDILFDDTGHTYNSNTERTMPNSSKVVTLLVQSTVHVWARVFAANSDGNCWFWYIPRISGTNGNSYGKFHYGGGTGITTPAYARKTGVPAGNCTILLREKEGYGSGLSYTVEYLEWLMLAVPEQ